MRSTRDKSPDERGRWLLQGANLDILKNLTRCSDAGQSSPFHKALELVERARVLARKVQIADRLRLVAGDRREVSGWLHV